jgi:hypothetical protein
MDVILQPWIELAEVDLFPLVKKDASLGLAFGKEVHGNHNIEWIPKNSHVLLDFWIQIRQPIATPMVKVSMNTVHLGNPTPPSVLRGYPRHG